MTFSAVPLIPLGPPFSSPVSLTTCGQPSHHLYTIQSGWGDPKAERFGTKAVWGLQSQLDPRCDPKVPWPDWASFLFPFPSLILCLSDLHSFPHDLSSFCHPLILETPPFIKNVKAFRCDLLPCPTSQHSSTPTLTKLWPESGGRKIPFLPDRQSFLLCAGPTDSGSSAYDPVSPGPTELTFVNTFSFHQSSTRAEDPAVQRKPAPGPRSPAGLFQSSSHQRQCSYPHWLLQPFLTGPALSLSL